ncbi:MAG: protein kinase [Methylophilaceae bacterium]
MDATLNQLQAGKLQGSTELKLSCGLTAFPKAIYDLADTLEILDLTGNALSSLPDDLDRFKKLRILFCSSNQFTEMPAVLGKCESLSMIGFKANQINHIPESAIPTNTLRWFIVTDNALTQVPESLGECKQLQKLMLAGNQLSKLPESMANCQALELLRISANQFTALPGWLFGLPKLTWLAYAGNPVSISVEQERLKQHIVNTIDWHALSLSHILGEGASGVTYQANCFPENAPSEKVAIKLFKGNLTSDGLPSSEMCANILAGSHPNLVGVIGVIENHPEGTLGLVMPLLDESLKILAGPPSFASCTRDVYDENQTFTEAQITNLLSCVAKATAHLHRQGLIHGDLYAHNILWKNNTAVLSDLGGASCLPLDEALAGQLMRIESQAFGVLMEELLNRSTLKHETSHVLWQLQKQCTAIDIALRPLLNNIFLSLQS